MRAVFQKKLIIPGLMQRMDAHIMYIHPIIILFYSAGTNLNTFPVWPVGPSFVETVR